MDISDKQVVIKGLLTSSLPIEETIATVLVYQIINSSIRKLVGEYDISLIGVFITDITSPDLLSLVIDKLTEV